LRRRAAFDAEQEAGLLGHLADGGQGQRAGELRAGIGDALVELGLHVGMNFAHRRHGGVERLDAPAREHELAGHELVTVVAAAEQHLGHRPRTVDQHHGRGVARLAVGKGGVALGFGHALGPDFAELRGVARHRAVRCFLPRYFCARSRRD
jgi:hypothetical protein